MSMENGSRCSGSVAHVFLHCWQWNHASRANGDEENHAEKMATGKTEDEFDKGEPMLERRALSCHTKGRYFAAEMLQAIDGVNDDNTGAWLIKVAPPCRPSEHWLPLANFSPRYV
jgi:hypothetical protein